MVGLLTAFFSQAAAPPPPYANEHDGGQYWYHGTGIDEHSFMEGDDEADRDPETRPSGGSLRSPETWEAEYGQNANKHWNTGLGVHFTSRHHVARGFATNEGGMETRAHPGARVAHAMLHMANPKHYDSEYDMAKDAAQYAQENGHHYIAEPQRHDPEVKEHLFHGGHPSEVEDHEHLHYVDDATTTDDRKAIHGIDHGEEPPFRRDYDQYLSLHPERPEIIEGFKDHLRKQGHDGITYGNEYEAPIGHRCAITFDDDQIHLRHWQWLHPKEQHRNKFAEGQEPQTQPEHLVQRNYTPEHGHHWVGPDGQKLSAKVEPLPIENGTYYRLHHNDRPFSRADASTTNAGDSIPGMEKYWEPKPGYSAFWDPQHVHQYLHAHGWDDEEHLRNSHVVRFKGTPIGEGADGEPRVMPHSDEPDERIPWKQFEQRGWVTTKGGNSRWDEHTWGEGPDGRIADDGYRTLDQFGRHMSKQASAPSEPERKPLPEGASDDEIIAHGDRLRKIHDGWKREIRSGLSEGRYTSREAKDAGYYGSGHDQGEGEGTWDDEGHHGLKWKPLPQSLYHVTTHRDDVLRDGLKSRDDLSQDRGKGLGGGESDTISYTDDPKVAHNIHRALHEYHSMLNMPLAEATRKMKDESDAGGYTDWVEGSIGKDGFTRGLRGHVRHRDTRNLMGLDEAREKIHPEAEFDEGAPVMRAFPEHDLPERSSHITRPATDDEAREQISSHYKSHVGARQHNGGPEDPLFSQNDVHGFAKMDPKQFAVIKAHPHPGAQGYQLSALGEWRTASSNAVHVDGVDESLHHQAGLNGDLPEGLTFRYYPGSEKHLTYHRIEARHEGGVIGSMDWNPVTRQIGLVEVDRQHQRKGIASEMLRRAWEVDPNVRHADVLSPDAEAWSQKVGGLHGDLPEGLEFRHVRDDLYGHAEETGDPEMALHALYADHNGRNVGGLTWAPDGRIDSVGVSEDYQRRGIANELFRRAQEITPDIHHSENQTDEAEAWEKGNPHKTAGLNGDLPDLTYQVHYRPKGEDLWLNEGQAVATAHHQGRPVGWLTWNYHAEPPRVDDLSVHPDYQRRGVATALFNHVKENHQSDLEHSDSLTEDGKGFRQSFGMVFNALLPGYEHEHEWLPDHGIFSRTKAELDPVLFGRRGKMRACVKKVVLARMDAAVHEVYPDWRDWTRSYFAGGEASYWWGNHDLDILVGIDYGKFRKAHPEDADLTDEEISAKITRLWRLGYNSETWTAPWDGEEWHVTAYSNPASWDIKDIKPYAAYLIDDDTWTVKPPKVDDTWGPGSFPESDWRAGEGYLQAIDAIDRITDPKVRAREGARLYEYLHGHRRDAFGAHGEGWMDPANVLWKFLEYNPSAPVEKLVNWTHQWHEFQANVPETSGS